MSTETKRLGAASSLQAIIFGRRPERTLLRVIALIVLAGIAFVLFRFVVSPVQISGPSMLPTLQDGRIHFLYRLAYRHHEPQRGDIVVIRYSGEHVTLAKRIIGLPGELVGFDGGRFYVNGKPLEEPYLKLRPANWQSEPKKLGPDEYYVVGDNRSMSFHNHYQGAAERRRILGKIIFHDNSP